MGSNPTPSAGGKPSFRISISAKIIPSLSLASVVPFVLKYIKLMKKNWLRIIARIWSVPVAAYALILLIGYFSNWVTTGKADPYAVEGYPFIENLPPTFLFLASLSLIFAWKWERIGAIINLSFCALAILSLLVQPDAFESTRQLMPFVLVLIVAVPGVLFWLRQ